MDHRVAEHLNPKPEDFSLVPMRALMAEARLMTEESTKGNHTPDGWRNVPPRIHVARGLRHGVRWMIDGDPEELLHAATRFHMALELELDGLAALRR